MHMADALLSPAVATTMYAASAAAAGYSISKLRKDNDPQKLPVTVLSRCLQFNLKRLDEDQISGQMIDIIHDNIGNSFPLAWSNEFDGIMLFKIYESIVNNDGDFASVYKKFEKVEIKKLDKMITQFEKNNHVGD